MPRRSRFRSIGSSSSRVRSRAGSNSIRDLYIMDHTSQYGAKVLSVGVPEVIIHAKFSLDIRGTGTRESPLIKRLQPIMPGLASLSGRALCSTHQLRSALIRLTISTHS